ncbi:saccharopine dehydrogenase family protein [Engelhardtia mirabilis]|uniref:Lysine 6-dehydrogenase n=1 Tax=Engelhardtia mirabilis TaxID=2528011 RepID=A0A518BI73_9BACT|nr:Lysine 6-dehydrogenase [Planctomycetes bacterium Pla133]QDV01007.1 Lysine 6-dehydrogenase [Planctomycetes bacterium Pla86]
MTATDRHHVFIAGGGGIGRALALLLRNEPTLPCAVTIGDLSLDAARSAAEFATADGEDPPPVAIAMPADGVSAELTAALSSADAIIDCLPGAQAPRMARLALEHGLHYLNLTEYVRETEEIQGLAQGASTCFALQCGLAPGYINVLANSLFERACETWEVNGVDSIAMRVGALTRHATAPHFYGWTWSPVGVATEYVEDAIVVREGETLRVKSLSERRTLLVDGRQFEEDLTSGGAADLPTALAGRVRHLDYKTLRHLGHYAWVDRQLAEIGAGTDRAARLQERMEAAIPHCDDDEVAIFASVEGLDSQGRRRALRRGWVCDPIEVGGRHLRAIQSTTAAGVAETLRLILERGLTGPLLQSQIPTREYLSGPFVRLAFGLPR